MNIVPIINTNDAVVPPPEPNSDLQGVNVGTESMGGDTGGDGGDGSRGAEEVSRVCLYSIHTHWSLVAVFSITHKQTLAETPLPSYLTSSALPSTIKSCACSLWGGGAVGMGLD